MYHDHYDLCDRFLCGVYRVPGKLGEDQLNSKYYTQVTVAYGETLWDLSDDYIDYDEYKNKKEYIAEVQSINHLAEEDSIRAGQTLIVPYYSYDFVK